MADAFDRLKQRKRQTVPARDASLVTTKDEMTELSHSKKAEAQLPAPIAPALQNIDHPGDTELARRTIRLEADIDTQLEQFCRSERITRDTFIEAVYLICSQDEKLRQQITAIAKDRYQHRKRLGDQRKFVTMAEKYSKN